MWQRTVHVTGSTEEWLATIRDLKEDGANFDDPESIAHRATASTDDKAEKALIVYLRELLPRQVVRFYILRELVVCGGWKLILKCISQ